MEYNTYDGHMDDCHVWYMYNVYTKLAVVFLRRKYALDHCN